MATDRYSVRLVSMSAEDSVGVFILDEDEEADQCRLILQFQGGEITAEALDYFEAMCHIRKELETQRVASCLLW